MIVEDIEGPAPPSDANPDADVVANGVTRQLLHAESAAEVRDILLHAVRQLGGTTILAADADDVESLPVDVSLGAGQPLLPIAVPGSAARANLERHLPRLVADARRALDLISRAERLSLEATTDGLTRLGNRTSFMRLLSRSDADDVIVALDLDGFKEVNDRYGHAAGDQVLRDFAACLVDHLRAGDHALRIGGDEFALVLRGTDIAGADALVDRLRTAWHERRTHPVGFSAGLARNLSTPATTHEAADRALYAAKGAGKDRSSVAEPGMDEDPGRR
ncbi:MAG: GGDEF domain-containing protein [Actinobacteria bacterium]|nr:GGDEF domain-containing protein [Actinomycetota bacterium]